MSDDLLKRSEEAVKYLRGVAEGFSGSITEKKFTTAAALIAELSAKLREREWQRLEDTGLMNCPDILAIDDMGCYYLGKLVNGKFYEPDHRRMSRHREVDIVKYKELPTPPKKEQDCDKS